MPAVILEYVPGYRLAQEHLGSHVSHPAQVFGLKNVNRVMLWRSH